MVKVLLYKLRTWQTGTVLRSQTTSTIITNYWRSPGNTSPVRIGLLSIRKSCIPSIHKLSLMIACYSILDIVAKWPGSTHDSRILMESGLTQLFEQMPLLLAIHVFHHKLLICNFCPTRYFLRGGGCT